MKNKRIIKRILLVGGIVGMGLGLRGLYYKNFRPSEYTQMVGTSYILQLCLGVFCFACLYAITRPNKSSN